jgi:hypothetical protein
LDLRPTFASALAALGVDAIITPPDEAPISAGLIWLATETVQVPIGGDYQRAEARRVACIATVDVPSLPRGTLISAPEAAGLPMSEWKVDAIDRIDFDHHRAVVVPVVAS